MWKHSREILRPHFYHRHYENLDIYRPHVENLLTAIDSDAALGGALNVVDLEPLFFRLTLDVTTEFLFGESVLSQRPTSSVSSHDFEDAFDLAQSISSKRLRFQKLYWLVDGKRLRKACNTIHRFADGVINRTLAGRAYDANGNSKPPFLKTIAQNFPEQDILRGQAINILTAGRDSTATFLSWTL